MGHEAYVRPVCSQQRGGRQRKVPFQSLLTSGHIDPKWRKLKGRHLREPSFDISPRDKWERLAYTRTFAKEVFNDASCHL